MRADLRLAVIVGARPQFIKAAAVSAAIRDLNRDGSRRIDEAIIHTGQHYDYEMSAVFFAQLGLAEPRHHLAVGSGTHGAQTGEMLNRIEEVLVGADYDIVLVFGDTNTTLAGGLAAAKLHIPVAHVESGLRSFNRRMPEEINRVLTDHLSDYLFCPSDDAIKNLTNEGISRGVFLVGDVMQDVLAINLELAAGQTEMLDRHRLEPGGYALATVHRAENTESRSQLQALLQGLDRVVQEGLRVVLPAHPRTRRVIEEWKLLTGGIEIIEPVSYQDMVMLQKNARVILTDSGGMQKEAYWLGVPCLTLRDETEWVETVEVGWNQLVGTDADLIAKAAFSDPPEKHRPQLYGDGKAAETIVKILTDLP